MKLYELVEQAYKDLELCEQMPNIIVSMGRWHEPDYLDDGTKVCHVCLAGAWLRGQGVPDNVDPTDADEMNKFRDDGTWQKMYALNKVRVGELREAYREFTHFAVDVPHGLKDMHMSSYGHPDFKPRLREAIARLREFDL